MIGKVVWCCSTLAFLFLSHLSAAAPPELFDDAVEQASFKSALKLDGELFHVQGLELDSRRIWVTSVDQASRRGYVHEFVRSTGRLLRRLELTDGARYHPGGMSLSGRSLWIPVAELKPNSSAMLIEVDADSLQVRRKIFVRDHLGCVAAANGVLVAGNWNTGLLYIFDLNGKASVRTVPNPGSTRYQDMKFVAGQLVAGGSRSLWSGAVDWIDWPSMKLHRSLRTGAVGSVRPLGRGGPFTGEGMTLQGRDLYLVPEDGPSRLFHFKLDDQRDA